MIPSSTGPIAPGQIVKVNGLDNSPSMFVSSCDRTNADCFWFNHNGDLANGRFPFSSLTRIKAVDMANSPPGTPALAPALAMR